MNALIFHVASGQCYFTGLALVISAVGLSLVARPIAKRFAVLTFIFGAIAIAISSTAPPYWVVGIASVALMVWLATLGVRKSRRWTALAVVAACLLAGVVEATYLPTRRLSPAPARAVTIMGDSVTAGMGGSDQSETWPRILARRHKLKVQDLSHAGGTSASARKRLVNEPIISPVVIIEIGGNDVLGPTTVAQFARDLDALLAAIALPGRQVVMLELPLPPFYHGFGQAQRRIAKKHGVILAPKRLFMSVLADPAATVDTIHLSQNGHEQMANCIWGLVKDAFAKNNDESEQPSNSTTQSP